jgi:transcriptional regulator with XRE-family HTH domain
MLDAHELAKRIREAMDRAVPKLTSASLAKSCNVTPQAVYEWRTTGRVSKGYLARIAAETRKPLEYFLGDETGAIAGSHGLTLSLEEALAVKRLQEASPEWRSYVLSLAMMERHEQDLMLKAMRYSVPDWKVEKAFGQAPHVAARKKDTKAK